MKRGYIEYAPVLTRLENQRKIHYLNITADVGYENKETFLYIERQGQTPYIKALTYEEWKKQFIGTPGPTINDTMVGFLMPQIN